MVDERLQGTLSGEFLLRNIYLKLENGHRPIRNKASSYAGKIAIGERGAADDPYRSNVIYGDHRGGIGTQEMGGAADITKAWWSTLDIRHNRHLVLGPLAHEVAPPYPSIGDVQIIFEHAGEIWAAFGKQLRKFQNASGTWSNTARTLPVRPTDAISVRLNTGAVRTFSTGVIGTGNVRHGMAILGAIVYIGFQPNTAGDMYVSKAFNKRTGQAEPGSDLSMPLLVDYEPAGMASYTVSDPDTIAMLYKSTAGNHLVRFYQTDGTEQQALRFTVERSHVTEPEAIAIDNMAGELLVADHGQLERYSLAAATYGERIELISIAGTPRFHGMTLLGGNVFGASVAGSESTVRKVKV